MKKGNPGRAGDIVGRIRAEESDSQARDFFFTLFDKFPALIWRSGVDAKCDYFNQTWLEFTGRSLEQERGDGWTGGVHPEDLAGCVEKYLEAFHARQPFTLEYRLRRHDGAFRWIIDHGQAFHDLRGQFAGYIGACFDVTERKAAEERIRFQASLLNQVRSAVVAIDREGRIVYWNRFAEGLYQWKAAECTGRNALELTVPADRRDDAREVIAATIEQGFWEGEMELCRRDGSRFTADVLVARIEDEQGAPLGLVGVSVDSTERRRAEKQLHRSEEQLRALTSRLQTVREEESERISREIHDELGQALTSLNLDLNWMQQNLGRISNRPLRAALHRRMAAMTARLETTVRSVQRISTELRPLMLDDLGLAATLEWQAEEFAARTGVRCRWTQRPTVKLPNRDQAIALFRIFQEILTNVGRHAHARSVRMKLVRQRGELILEVADDGKGFNETKLRDHRSLGLLGMRERAGFVGGRMEISSAPGRGTKVTVTCPLPGKEKGGKTKKGGTHGGKNQDPHR